MTLAITFLLGMFFLVGIYIIKAAKNVAIIEHLSIAIASGALVMLLAMDLLPEAVESFEGVAWWMPVVFVAAGVGLLMILDIFIPEHGDNHDPEGEIIHIGLIASFAIILHNVIEGMAVYGLACESLRQGAVLAIGVGLHNIPMGMLIYSTLKKEEKKKEHVVIGMACISTFLGGLIMAMVSGYMNQVLLGALICITVGMILFILFLELIPYMIRAKKPSVSVIGALAGIAIVFISMMFE